MLAPGAMIASRKRGESWARALGLALQAPMYRATGMGLENHISVHIWQCVKTLYPW